MGIRRWGWKGVKPELLWNLYGLVRGLDLTWKMAEMDRFEQTSA